MKLNKKGIIIVISGPSGVGKGEIKKALLLRDQNKNFVYSISMTTRPPRASEKEGIDYFFTDEVTFQKKIQENFFLEYNKFLNYFYGTPYCHVLQQLNQNKEVLLEIDIQGALQMRKHKINKNAIFIFIAPPSKKSLYERLKKRNTESDEVLRQRMCKADEEFRLAYKYDYIVVNDEIENAVDKILSIIAAEHSKTKNSISFYLSKILNEKS